MLFRIPLSEIEKQSNACHQPPGDNADGGKFSMRRKLIPVGCMAMLDAAWIWTAQPGRLTFHFRKNSTSSAVAFAWLLT